MHLLTLVVSKKIIYVISKKHWALFEEKKLKSRCRPIIAVYKEFVCSKGDNIRGDTVLLRIMMTVSSNAVVCEPIFR